MRDEYSAQSIQILKGLEHVRKRPGMYIGSTGPDGLHHLVYEVVDNSIDEALVGHCSEISVIIDRGNIITVEDNGRGIPVDLHPIEKVSALEIVMTKLHAGGKFDKKSYKISGGLHGVGVSVVNALSEWCKVYVQKGNKVYYQHYNRGLPEEKVKVTGECEAHGTKTVFKPDPDIFGKINFSFDILSNRLRELAFLNKGIKINIADKRLSKEKKHNFEFKGGLKTFILYLNKNKKAIHKEPIFITGDKEDIVVEVALEYNESYTENIYSYVNNILQGQ